MPSFFPSFDRFIFKSELKPTIRQNTVRPFFSANTRKKIRNSNNNDAAITITTAKKQVFHSLLIFFVCVFVCMQTANIHKHTHTNGSFARIAHEPLFCTFDAIGIRIQKGSFYPKSTSAAAAAHIRWAKIFRSSCTLNFVA